MKKLQILFEVPIEDDWDIDDLAKMVTDRGIRYPDEFIACVVGDAFEKAVNNYKELEDHLKDIKSLVDDPDYFKNYYYYFKN